MGKQKVTQEIEKSFVEMYVQDRISVEKIAKKYEVGTSTVWRYLKKYDVPVFSQSPTMEEEQQIIQLYENGYSQQAIEDKIGYTRITVRKILRKHNIHIRDNTEYRDYKLNEEYFDEIDTPNKAYVLGFLYADGNVSKEKYHIQLSLQEGDKEILERISEDMDSECPLSFRNFEQYNDKYHKLTQNQYCLLLNSKHMHTSLAKWGVVPCKTHIIKYPDFLSDDLHRHFIRGVLDGDGCIHPPYGKNNKIKNVDICGTYDFCSGLKNIIENSIDIHCSIIKINKNGTTFRITISGGNQVSKFLDWIYEDADLYLKRKYDLYQKYYNKKIA